MLLPVPLGIPWIRLPHPIVVHPNPRRVVNQGLLLSTLASAFCPTEEPEYFLDNPVSSDRWNPIRQIRTETNRRQLQPAYGRAGAPLSHGGRLWNTGDWTELPQGVLLREAHPLGPMDAGGPGSEVVPGPFPLWSDAGRGGSAAMKRA